MSWDDNLRISSYRQGPAADLVAEALAQRFHEAYERLAPDFGYETRAASRKPWSEVPENNRRLMTAVCAEMLADFDPGEVAQHFTELADRLATAEVARDEARELLEEGLVEVYRHKPKSEDCNTWCIECADDWPCWTARGNAFVAAALDAGAAPPEEEPK